MKGNRQLSSFLSKKTKQGRAQRDALAKRLKSGRLKDIKSTDVLARPEQGWNVSRGLSSMGVFRHRFIDSVIRVRKNKKVPIKILDVGAGLGYFGNDLRLVAGKDSVVHGLRLALSGPNERRIVRQTLNSELVGSIENYRFKTKYDFIFSVAGGTVYTANLPIALEKTCNSLNKGGEAILHVMPTKIKPLMGALREKGFEINYVPNSKKRLVHIVNVNGKLLKFDKQIRQELKKPIKPRLSINMKKN